MKKILKNNSKERIFWNNGFGAREGEMAMKARRMEFGLSGIDLIFANKFFRWPCSVPESYVVGVLKAVLKIAKKKERVREMTILCLMTEDKMLSQFAVEIITASQSQSC